MEKNISFTLRVWRQNGPTAKGHFDTFEMKDITGDTSFLEMLDILNEQLIEDGQEPFVFDHDCREGICGMCSLYINGHPHGLATGATTCQLYMRRFNDGDVITVELGAQPHSQLSRIAWLTVAHSTRLFRQVATPVFAPDNHRTPMPSLFPKRLPTKQWTVPHVSVARLALQLARTVRQCCSSLQRSVSWHCSHRVAQRLQDVQEHDYEDGGARLR